MSSDRLPWLKFWPADWQRDLSLRTVSLAARGLWIELIGVMNGCEPYGHLVINGGAPSFGQIALLIGSSAREVSKLLAELEVAGVFSRTEEGIIYSRRMVRDQEMRLRAQAYGSTGGNPALKGGGYPSGNGGDKGHARANLEARIREEESEPYCGRVPVTARAPAAIEADWKPSEEGKALATGLGLDVARTLRMFLSHYLANGAARVDWQAQWSKWCDDEVNFAARKPSETRNGMTQVFGEMRRSRDAEPREDRDEPNRFLN